MSISTFLISISFDIFSITKSLYTVTLVVPGWFSLPIKPTIFINHFRTTFANGKSSKASGNILKKFRGNFMNIFGKYWRNQGKFWFNLTKIHVVEKYGICGTFSHLWYWNNSVWRRFQASISVLLQKTDLAKFQFRVWRCLWVCILES